MRQRRWIELFSDYDSEIRYHPEKANVVADAFSRKERVKPRLVRAMSMTIRSSVTEKILAAQGESSKNRIPLIGDVRTIIMDETHASRYLVHPEADKTYYDLGDMHWWPCMKKDVATYVSNCLTYSKVKAETSKTFGYTKRLQDEKLARIYIDEIVARHRVPVSIISDYDERSTSQFLQTSPVLWAEIGESRLIGPELKEAFGIEVSDQVLLKVSPWKGVVRFGKKGKSAPRYVGPFEILE
ncbi:putative reverse transcriptase domain-containing protein [Tanacetum coccineum]